MNVENVNLVAWVGPSVLSAVIVALDAPLFLPLFMRCTNVDVILWPLLIVVWLMFIDTEFLRTKNKTKCVQQQIPYLSVNSQQNPLLTN